MLTRRDFVRSTTALAAVTPVRSAELLLQRTTKPVVIADYSGYEFTNGGKENAVARAFRLITEGKDVLDALRNPKTKPGKKDGQPFFEPLEKALTEFAESFVADAK